jgi:hypothetical protein
VEKGQECVLVRGTEETKLMDQMMMEQGRRECDKKAPQKRNFSHLFFRLSVKFFASSPGKYDEGKRERKFFFEKKKVFLCVFRPSKKSVHTAESELNFSL